MIAMASIVVKDCVCRQNCAPNGKNLGIVNGTFEVLEERERNGVTWYRVGSDRWIQAGSGVDLIIDINDISESNIQFPDVEDKNSPVEDVEVDQFDEYEETKDVLDDSTAEQDDFESAEQPELHDVDTEYDEYGGSYDNIQDNDEATPPIPYSVGDIVSFSGRKHYASSSGQGGAFVKPCMATVVEYVPGEEYPIKLHRCNAAGYLISRGSMGYVSLGDVCLIRSNS